MFLFIKRRRCFQVTSSSFLSCWRRLQPPGCNVSSTSPTPSTCSPRWTVRPSRSVPFKRNTSPWTSPTSTRQGPAEAANSPGSSFRPPTGDPSSGRESSTRSCLSTSWWETSLSGALSTRQTTLTSTCAPSPMTATAGTTEFSTLAGQSFCARRRRHLMTKDI